MTLRVVPEGLAAASAAVEALTARLAAAHASAAPVITAVVPPAADPVSLQTAAGFSAQGVEHAVVTAEGVEELGAPALVWANPAPATWPVMRPPPLRTGSWAAEHGRAHLDGFAAGGTFGVA
ncbi:PE family protein [Mycobacterium tuberculosis CAS/NITR204]|uniref:PE family protein n=1 Tax=Mycobacterium tuberculosis CAS/NITR204 TaxID=1310114 RepID=R4M9F6_MYCTX|nr:PE family protein [Mycobacterium tuberculosis CAS/NITR204]